MYPTWKQLEDAGHTPDFLYIGACAMRALCATSAPLSRVMPEPADKETTRAQVERYRRAQGVPPRKFKSRFVGVTQHRGRWLAQWGRHGATKGRAFPLTDEGEYAAALERARVLGLSEPELRLAEQVAQREETRALEACGHAKTRLGGKRIA